MIDKIDKEIIEILQKNALYRSDAIAQQLNLGSSTVRRRLKKLLDSETIRFVAVPNWEKVGLPVVALIALDVDPHKIRSVSRKLSEYDNCKWLAVTSGRFSVMSIWQFPSTEALYTHIEIEIGKLEGVIKSETFIGLHLEKFL
jgi:Lrp/AsnC family transcriptional regulator for asnA, asnC and gidA